MNEQIYTVSNITKIIKSLLLTTFSGQIKITGEISNYKLHSSGHLYFSLKDEKALIKAVMFSARTKLKQQFSEGDKVIVSGTISVYEPQGNYQIIVNTIEKSGEGELYKQFLKIKKQLEEKGLFNEKHKKQLPEYPLSIGIVTSPTGAVIKDIKNVLQRRAPYIKKYLYPANVQGENAHKSLIKGIEYFNNIFPVDIIIIGRGGGSIEDLWEFNNEQLAYTVFNSKIPVISAVGHETDFTIIDFVADKRAPTPSAAAEIAVKDKKDIISILQNSQKTMEKSLLNKIHERKNTLISLKKEFYISAIQLINFKKQLLSDYNIQMENSLKNKIKNLKNQINILYREIHSKSPEKYYLNIKLQLNELKNNLNNTINNKIKYIHIKINELKKSLEYLSPLNILEKGYSLVYNEKNDIIKSSKQVSIDDNILIKLKTGTLKSKITFKE